MNNAFVNRATTTAGDTVTLTINDPNGVRVYDAVVHDGNYPTRDLKHAQQLNGCVCAVRIIKRLYPLTN